MSKIKTKKLILEYSYLNLEKEEVTQICSEVEKEMKDYIMKNYPDEYDIIYNQTTPESEEEEEPENNPDFVPKSKELKKLYHRITKKTHPDKTGNDDYSSVFSDAVKAYKDNDLGRLLEIASQINIELGSLSKEALKLLEKNVDSVKKEIHTKKNTVAWAWNIDSSDEARKYLIEFLVEQRRKQ
jgi:hypothetical protein